MHGMWRGKGKEIKGIRDVVRVLFLGEMERNKKKGHKSPVLE
jgi:hypothetical protein